MTTSDPIAFERVNPETGDVRVFRTEADLDHTPGDVVSTPRGVGVVNATMTEEFDFPQSEAGETQVSASADTPAYIVGFGGRSAPYRGAALEDGDLYTPRANDARQSALAGPVTSRGFDREAMKPNWGKRDLLQWWANAGGLWRRARQYVKEEQGVDDETARGLVSKRKDMVLGTDRWRTRF